MSLLVAHLSDTQLEVAAHRADPATGLNWRLVRRYECFRWAVEDAVKRGASLILHSGDVFESRRPVPTVVDLARRALEPALEAGVLVIAIEGNHDMVASEFERDGLDLLKEIEGMTVVDRPGVYYVLSYDHDDMWVGEAPGMAQCGGSTDPPTPPDPQPDVLLAIACLPWPNQSVLLASEEGRGLDPAQKNLVLSQKVCEIIAGLAAECGGGGVPAILLAHLMVEGSVAGSEQRLMSMGRSWTVPLSAIASPANMPAGPGPWAYVALGHVHRAQELGSREQGAGRRGAVVRYAGAPEIMDFGEEGETPSYSLLRFEDGDLESVTEIATPATRYLTIAPGEDLPPDAVPARTVVRVKGAPGQAVDVTAEARRLEALGVGEARIETTPPVVAEREVGVGVEALPEQHLRAWCGREGGETGEREEAIVRDGLAIIEAVGDAS